MAAPMPTEAEFTEWRERRDKALIELDENYVFKTCGAPPELRLSILHKARYECTSIPAAYRHASAEWLMERGLSRMTGSPLLPKGELPE